MFSCLSELTGGTAFFIFGDKLYFFAHHRCVTPLYLHSYMAAGFKAKGKRQKAKGKRQKEKGKRKKEKGKRKNA